jgi:hypothetical protein
LIHFSAINVGLCLQLSCFLGQRKFATIIENGFVLGKVLSEGSQFMQNFFETKRIKGDKSAFGDVQVLDIELHFVE